MLTQLAIGAVMIAVTVFIEAFALDAIIDKVREKEKSQILKRFGALRKEVLLSLVVLSVFCVLIFAMWLWAGLYYVLQIFPDFETVLYFSMATFSTVGYGDVVIGPDWRLLGGIESANGFLLFGWNTAFIFEVTTILYRKETGLAQK
ncbi:MAG: ion channel [Pseudomonadota bacterium]